MAEGEQLSVCCTGCSRHLQAVAVLQLHCSRLLRVSRCLHSANTMRAYANAGLDLLLAAGTEGAARKGHFCVRAFGGVVAYPVIKQRVCAPCLRCALWSDHVHKN